MKNLGLSLIAVAGLAVAASAAPVSSVCTFETPAGQQASARFDIADLLVRSTLTIAGVDVPALQPTCYAHKRGGLRCPHDDGQRRYELFPRIDDDNNQVVGLRVLVWQGDDATPVESADCRPL